MGDVVMGDVPSSDVPTMDLPSVDAPVAVEVTVRAERGRCELSVRDTGAGLAAEELDAVFGAFMQSERTRRESGGGLGIGLALVRELAVRHGGSVRAASPGPGLGATFTIELPLADPLDAGHDGS